MKKTIVILMIITLASKILGFSRELLLSYFYGASNISDAYLISTTIPATIFAFIGVGISTSFIPMYNKISYENGILNANKFTSNILNFLIIFCIVIIILVLMFTNFFVSLFASGFDQETMLLAVMLTKISILGIFFTTIVYIFNAYLQLKNNFLIPSLTGIPLNFVIMISIIASYYFELYYLAIGSVIAAFSQFIFLIPSIKKEGYKFSFHINLKDENTKKFIFLSLPVIVGVSINQINILIDRTLASRLVTGGVSALVYADRLMVFIQGIFVTSLITVYYPKISDLAAKKNWYELKSVIIKTSKLTIIVLVPITCLVMINSKEIISVLFGRGEFDVKAIHLTSQALFFYGVGILGIAIREIFSKSFYAVQDTRTPIINAGIAVLLNIILNMVLSKYLGVGGLALASSISAIISAILIYISFKKKFGAFKNEKLPSFLLKILFATIFLIITLIISQNLFSIYLNEILTLIVSLTICLCVYTMMLLIFKIEEMQIILSYIKRRNKK